MKVSSQDMCTRRAMDFAPTPSTLLLLCGVLRNLTCQCRNTTNIPDRHRHSYNLTYQPVLVNFEYVCQCFRMAFLQSKLTSLSSA